MTEKDVEKKLKEQVRNVKTRDFSVVWNEISGEIEPPTVKRTRKPFFWKIASIAAAVLIICAISIPILLNLPRDMTEYFIDQLSIEIVNQDDFYSQLQSSGVQCIEISDYDISSLAIYKSPEGFVKGGAIEFVDNIEEPDFLCIIHFYSQDVKINENLTENYIQAHLSNGLAFEYRLKEFYQDIGTYVYDIKVSYKSINYQIELTCFSDNITPYMEILFN